jgi:hypothetical protein
VLPTDLPFVGFTHWCLWSMCARCGLTCEVTRAVAAPCRACQLPAVEPGLGLQDVFQHPLRPGALPPALIGQAPLHEKVGGPRTRATPSCTARSSRKHTCTPPHAQAQNTCLPHAHSSSGSPPRLHPARRVWAAARAHPPAQLRPAARLLALRLLRVAYPGQRPTYTPATDAAAYQSSRHSSVASSGCPATNSCGASQPPPP